LKSGSFVRSKITSSQDAESTEESSGENLEKGKRKNSLSKRRRNTIGRKSSKNLKKPLENVAEKTGSMKMDEAGTKKKRPSSKE